MRFKCSLNKITYIELRLLKISARNTNAFAHLKIFIQLIQKYTFDILPQKPLGGSLPKKRKCAKRIFSAHPLHYLYSIIFYSKAPIRNMFTSLSERKRHCPLFKFFFVNPAKYTLSRRTTR